MASRKEWNLSVKGCCLRRRVTEWGATGTVRVVSWRSGELLGLFTSSGDGVGSYWGCSRRQATEWGATGALAMSRDKGSCSAGSSGQCVLSRWASESRGLCTGSVTDVWPNLQGLWWWWFALGSGLLSSSLPTVWCSRKNVWETVSFPVLRYRLSHLGPTETASLSSHRAPWGRNMWFWTTVCV